MSDILPESIIFNTEKIGFKTPIRKVIVEDSNVQDILLNGTINKRNLFNERALKRLLDVTISGKKDHSPLLFRILTVEIWFRTFIDQ
jgi:asparagine synthase (glutamine-hydrolysing)